jgi:hypothetical protein
VEDANHQTFWVIPNHAPITAHTKGFPTVTEQYDKIINQLLSSMEKPTPEALYNHLGRLRNEMPSASELGKASASKWIGSVVAVVDASKNSIVELVALRTYFDFAARNSASEVTAKLVAQNIDTVIARLELMLPAEAHGAFIPAGGMFDGFQAVSKAMRGAHSQVLLVDPYADDTMISDFVPLAPEGVRVSLLSDQHNARPSLKPAAERWAAQWQDRRPLEVRLAPARSLHDRLIIVDGATTWVVGQSFKDLAKRAHSSLVRVDPETAVLKSRAYADIWKVAVPV